MAEIEKVTSTASSVTVATDIPSPVSSLDAGGNSVGEYGTSPTQERSSNSHLHDSEYDTASDLEGGEEYDDEDDEDLDDESITDGESITDDEVVVAQEKAEIEAQKKVDEDRSNPQYIPKRGTFYEHDDRTAEFDVSIVSTVGESGDVLEGIGMKPPQSPTISQASKTMKKWQPASAVERWTHDRFDASEQAPKSRAELVSAYGYDIRTEDAPPRARRRRRYGRGPSKYSRNWEDESAYLKASNKERKPPRPSDFPALNERSIKTRKVRITREEKENRMEKRAVEEKVDGSRPSLQDERREGKVTNKSQKVGRQSTQSQSRQVPMEFKQKQRNLYPQAASTSANAIGNRSDIPQNDRHGNSMQSQQPMAVANEQPHNSGAKQTQTLSKYSSRESYIQMDGGYTKGGNNSNHSYQHIPQINQSQQQGGSTRQQPLHKPTQASNLSQRLQQVQNRNDPSHVGSVQMHALATQNQIVNQTQQLNPSMAVNTQQQPAQQMPQEQRGPPKRYSSLRRSQHEAQHIAEQMQHMHIQQPQQSPIIMQDQHMLQSNLMQLYHQENLQAQMQVLQANQPSGQQKQQAYPNVTTGTPPQPYTGTANSAATPAAYYVASPDAFNAAGTSNTQAQSNAQYAQQPQNYLPPAQAGGAATLSYPAGPSSSQTQVSGAVSNTYGTSAAVQPSTVATTGAAGTSGNSNFPNYQNYNTVGGTTYFVPPAQTSSRPVVLPQRRPTNAIPILPPSEKNKLRSSETKEEEKTGNANTTQPVSLSSAPIGSAENIDHIIDNMFVQRPAFQPPQAVVSQTHKGSSPISDNNSEDIANSSIVIPPDDTVASATITEKNKNNFVEDSVDNSKSSIIGKE